MFGLGPLEIVVIAAIAVMIYGKRLPEVGRTFGKTMGHQTSHSVAASYRPSRGWERSSGPRGRPGRHPGGAAMEREMAVINLECEGRQGRGVDATAVTTPDSVWLPTAVKRSAVAMLER